MFSALTRTEADNSSGEAKCQELLPGSAEVENKRLSLMSQKEKLAKFQAILSQVRNGVELDEYSPTFAIDDSLASTLEDDETSTPHRNSHDRGPVGAFAQQQT